MEEGKKFKNRKEAGLRLGRVLLEDYKNSNPVVLGIPRGGVEVGYYVANMLGGEFTAIVTKKLSLPIFRELAIGAVSEDGSYFLLESGKSMEESNVDQIVKDQYREVKERIILYRKGKNLPDMKNRTVIIIDDGIATGATLVAALETCKSRGAGKLVVAAPVSGRRFASKVIELADDIRILVQPNDFYAVGQVYEDFYNLSDNQLIKILKDYNEDQEIFRNAISSER